MAPSSTQRRAVANPIPVPADVIWCYAGVRPLYDDGSENPSAVTRDYVLRLDTDVLAAALFPAVGATAVGGAA